MNAQGFALSQLPERFQQRPQSEQLSEYIARKYGKYGFKRSNSILFNREWQPEKTTERYRWIENVSKGLRRVGEVGDIIRMDHNGWYTDNFQNETVSGEVWQLPARDGEPQYVPAVEDPCNPNCAALDFHSITTDKEECARWADSMAEQWAEREREYQAREDAKNRLEAIEAEIKDEYKDFRRITREIRGNCDALKGIQVVRELVKDRWQETKASIRKLRREQKRIEENGIEY
jgi:hypothetical protein